MAEYQAVLADVRLGPAPGYFAAPFERTSGMDRSIGAPDALQFVRRLTQIEPPEAAFDAAFSSSQ
jgi:hypothetical protein